MFIKSNWVCSCAMCALCFCSAVMTSTRALNAPAGFSYILHKRTPVYQTQTKLYPWIVAGIFVFCDRFLHSPGARNSSISVIRPYFKLKVNLQSKPPAKPRVSAGRELVESTYGNPGDQLAADLYLYPINDWRMSWREMRVGTLFILLLSGP